MSRRRALLATTTAIVIAGFGAAAHAATPIDTAQPFYLQSQVGTTVNPDFQGGKLRDDQNNVTDNNNYNVENFPTNTIDAFGHTTTFTGAFSGAGPLTITDSVGGGAVVATGASVIGGTLTINNGATLQWGSGGSAFLVGAGNAVVDNGALVMDFGGGGIGGSIPISGTGSVEIKSGSLNDGGNSTYTGATTIDPTGLLLLSGSGSIASSSNVIVNGTFDISGVTTGASIKTLTGSGSVSLGAKTLTLTNASGTFGGVIADGGLFGGTGASFTIAGGTETLTGASTVGGTVTIDSGATMQWGNGNSAFLVGAGNAVVDNGALVMNFGGGGIGGAIPISGTGSVEVQSGALTQSGAATYTGVTKIDPGGFLNLSGAGSIANSSNLLVNGTFDISGTATGASITTLTGSGGVSLGAKTLTLTAASGTFSGVIADGGLFGGTGGGLTIAGGTETLTGTNTFTGPTTINGGATLQLGNGGTTGSVAGGIVDNGLVRFDYGGPVTVGNAFSGSGNVEVAAGTAVITGASFVGGAVTIDNGATMQWGSGGPSFLVGAGNSVVDNGALVMNFGGGGIAGAIPISGTGTVEIQSGSLNDSGASTYTGVTTIDPAGVLVLSGAGSIANSSNLLVSGTFDISGTATGASITTLTGSGGVSLGAKTLTLTAASGTFGGVIADGGLFGGTGGGLTIAGGTETLTGTNTFTGLTTIDLGATLKLAGAGALASAALVNGTFDISGANGGESLISLAGSGHVALGANTLTLTDASGVFSGAISGAGGFTVGSGAEILTGAVTYTGTTLINTGAALQLGAGGGAVGPLTGPITDNGLLVFNGGAGSNSTYATGITGSGSLTLASGALTLTGTNTYTGTTGVNAGATLQLGAGGATGTVAGPIVDNGLVKFDYGGPVTAPNAFSGSGSAEVVAGTVVVTAASNLGGTVTIDSGATMQWGSGGPAFLVGAGNSVVDNGALVMNFGGGGVGGSIPISGAGSVTLQSGSLNDSAVSTYTGPTTIGAGALFALSGGGSIAVSSNVAVSGTFDVSGTAAGTSIKTLSGSGGVSLGGKTLTLTAASGAFGGVLADGGLAGGTGGGLTIAGGTETLSGTNTFTGPTTINAGAALQLGAGGASGSVAGAIVDNGSLAFDRSDVFVVSQSISGSGALNQIGAGTVILDAANPVSGLTTISAGALEVGDAAHPGATLGGNVVVGAQGTLMGHGTIVGSVTNGGVVSPGGTIGTLTVGSYTQGPGGTLAIEVSPAAASLLNSVGAVSLNGKLALTFDPGAYSPHIYEIVAGSAVSGTFASVSATGSPTQGEAFGLIYTPTQVDLLAEATGGAEVYGGVSAATIDRAENFATLVEDRFGDAGCPDGSVDKTAPACAGYGAWAFAIGSWDRRDADGGVFGFRNDGVGVVGGIDRSWENGSLVGGAFGYVHNDLSMDAATAKASGPSYYGAIYGRFVDGRVWFDGEAFYMHTGWAVDRTVAGVGVAVSGASASSEGFLLQASAPIRDTGLRPYARFTYVFSDRGAAFEQGAGQFGFAINSASKSAPTGEVGLLYEATVATSSGVVLRPAVQLGVQDTFGSRGQTVTGSLVGLTGSAFEQVAPRLWGVAGVFDGSLKVRVNQSFELFGDLSGRVGDHQTDAVASVGGVLRF
ncbi:MAG TPA: autotransporter-associated beta strand repeat-containing protein [Caulobacteraceae bacterium]|nr:autotransporter-associated beta strand repeat-containing protein [Caulobacteraceae bacterium]